MFKLEYMVVGNVNFYELTFFLVETMFWSNWIQLLIVDILDDEITYAFFLLEPENGLVLRERSAGISI